MRDISDLDDGEANSPIGYRHIPEKEEGSLKQWLIDLGLLFFVLFMAFGIFIIMFLRAVFRDG